MAETNYARYNARDCTIMVGGIYITGLGENMISYSKEEPYFETSVGAQGDVIKNEINNNIWTLTISVQQTSPQLKYLLSLKGGRIMVPVWVVNKELKIRLGGSKACIAEAPEVSLSAQAEDLEITFTIFDGILEGM